MSNFDPDRPSDNEWEERGELAWNEFDWERYLREQDDVIRRYLHHYERLKHSPERIDEAAHLMGWDDEAWSCDDGTSPAEAPVDLGDYDVEPYTLHKNPVFIATSAIFSGLNQAWLRVASDSTKIPQPLAVAYLAVLHRTEQQSALAIQALDLGDYAMAISLLKRALWELNASLGLFDQSAIAHHPAIAVFREDALPRLFDLREIWLRVMSECREELERPVEGDDEG